MKKLFSIILGVFFAFGTFADDVTKITSKTYVDTETAKKQDIVPAVNANTVLTHTNTAGVVGQKAIYDESGTYAGQETALVTAGTADSAIQMAIDGEFVCANPPTCTLWRIKSNHLPNGYTQLEYIESTGTQYIDTGVISDGIGLSVDTKVMFLDLSAEMSICGRDSSGGFDLLSMISNSSGIIQLFNYRQPTRVVTVRNIETNTIYNINASTTSTQMNLSLNGNTVTSTNAPISCTPASVTLFRHAAQFYAIIKMYYFKLYNNGVLVRDFIPARRDSDGVLGMYDLVSDTFFTNSGTGTFIAGPVASYIPQNQ